MTQNYWPTKRNKLLSAGGGGVGVENWISNSQRLFINSNRETLHLPKLVHSVKSPKSRVKSPEAFDLLGNFRCELFFNSNSLVCCSLNLAGKMSRRIAQSSINWAAIAERVPPNQRTNFTAFKSKSDKYLRRWVGMNVKKNIRELVG